MDFELPKSMLQILQIKFNPQNKYDQFIDSVKTFKTNKHNKSGRFYDLGNNQYKRRVIRNANEYYH